MPPTPEPEETLAVPSWVLIAAFRYALGRMSYVTDDIVEQIQLHWSTLPQRYRTLILRETNAYLERAVQTDWGDLRPWRALVAFIEVQL